MVPKLENRQDDGSYPVECGGRATFGPNGGCNKSEGGLDHPQSECKGPPNHDPDSWHPKSSRYSRRGSSIWFGSSITSKGVWELTCTHFTDSPLDTWFLHKVPIRGSELTEGWTRRGTDSELTFPRLLEKWERLGSKEYEHRKAAAASIDFIDDAAKKNAVKEKTAEKVAYMKAFKEKLRALIGALRKVKPSSLLQRDPATLNSRQRCLYKLQFEDVSEAVQAVPQALSEAREACNALPAAEKALEDAHKAFEAVN